MRRERILPILLLVAAGLALYWLLRPETYRFPNASTAGVQQVIPSELPTGRTVFIEVAAGDLNRMEMFYRVAGDPAHPVIVLLHGIAGDSGTTWYNTYAALAQDYYVIAPDLRGHGMTMQPPGGTSIEQMAEDVVALLRVLGIERASVAGHSMGGLIAMQLTHEHPNMVDKLVLLDTAATWNYGVVQYGLPLYPYWVRIVNRTVGWQQENRNRASAFTRYEVEPEYNEWVYQRRQFNQTEAFLEAWRAVINFSAVDYLPSFTQPTLIIYGEDDDLVVAEQREQLHSLIPNSQIITIPSPSRHYPQIQFADVVNPLLIAFLANEHVD